MAISDDFTISYAAKTVTHTSGTTVYTALAFFQWLATTFAAAAQMDDDYPFVSDTPQVYRWVNGWDMGDETSYQFLRGGAVETSDAQKLFANLYSIGTQFRNSMIYLVQSDAEVSPWWIPGNIDILIKVKTAGALIDNGIVWVYSRDTDVLYDHNSVDLSAGGRNPVGANTSEDLNYKTTGDIYLDVDTVANFDVGNFAYGVTSTASGRIQYVDTPNTRLYLCQVEGTFQISENIVERATRTGTNLDGTATNHVTTAEFNVIKGYNNIAFAFVQRSFSGGTVGGGPFVVGETVNQAVSGWAGRFVGVVSNVLYCENTSGTPNGTNTLTGVTSGATYTPTSTAAATSLNKDLNNGAGLKPYNAVVDGAARSVLQIYQYLKYVCAHNSASTINGDTGEEYRSANEASYAEVKQAPFGSFAGGVLFGARGIWLEDYATASFQLIDANGDQQLPPNYQKVSASHTSLSGCRILFAERSGANIIKNQYIVLSHTSNSITMTASIDANKAPQSGNARWGDDIFAYTGFSGAALTGVTPDPTIDSGAITCNVVASAGTFTRSAGSFITDGFAVGQTITTSGFTNGGNNTTKIISTLTATVITVTDNSGLVDETGNGDENVKRTGPLYIPLLDVLADATSEESANIILTAAFDIKVRVRKYGFKDFTQDTSLPTAGLAVTPVLTSDPQAS